MDHMARPWPYSPAEGGLKLRAIVCEARPLCEGVALAEAWARAGIDVTLITDAQASPLIEEGNRRRHGATRAGTAAPPPIPCLPLRCLPTCCLPAPSPCRRGCL